MIRLEFQTAVVSVMVALSSYGNNLDQYHQQLLINTLTRSTGTDPRCSRQSINSLTICMVDMRETMMKLLPDVLLRLSKISATIYIAMPVLEFLSSESQDYSFLESTACLRSVLKERDGILICNNLDSKYT